MDIKTGDILVVANKQYSIRSVEDWRAGNFVFSAESFARLATFTAYTMRSPAIVSGKRGSPAVNLTNFNCLPLDPVAPETARRLAIDTPYDLLETYVAEATGFYHLVVEETRN